MAVKIWIMSHPSSGEKKMRTKHSVTSMQLLYPSTGIASWQKVAHISASPDGFMWCSCCGEAIVYCICDFSVRESWEKTDFLVLRNNTIQFKKEHKYYYQVVDLKCVCQILSATFLFELWRSYTLNLLSLTLDFGQMSCWNLSCFLSHIWPKFCLDYMSSSVLYVRSQFWSVKNFLMTHLITVFAVIIVLYGSTSIVCKSAALRKSKSGSARLA